MDKFVLLDLNKLTWQIDVAIIASIFSIFSLIYRPEFIYYGFLTFAFGIVAHIVFLFWEWVLRCINEKVPEKRILFYIVCFLEHLSNILFAVVWLNWIRSFYF